MSRLKPIKLITAVIILLVGLMATPALAASERSETAQSKASTRTTKTTTTHNSSEQICDGDSGNKSDTGHGANQNGPHEVDGEGPYDDTCGEAEDPSSQNGNNTGGAKGKPDAGTVGQADNKNPPGQNPNATDDGNNGYECDGNTGVAKTNPAHTGCPKASSEPQPVRAAFASIGTVDCIDNIAEVFIRNDNNAVAGSRTFIITFDGASTNYVLASGASQTINLTIPDDGKTHTVKVESAGMTDKTARLRIPSNCDPHLAAFASIGTVDCSDNIAEVFIRNDNNTVAGSRTFTVTFDGTSTDYVLASGASRTINLTIPDDGRAHSVKVESAGMTDKTASLRIPADCDDLDLAGSASIGTVDCTDKIAEVTMNNLNETAGGARTFLVTFDGVSTSHSVAAGGTLTVDLTIPDTGTHSISVSSLGMTTQSATRSIPANCDGTQAGAAQIGSIDCEDNIAEVVLSNSNALGNRVFNVTANGSTTSYSVSPGSSRVVQLEFPKAGEFTKPGSYLVTVASAGLADVTKTLTVPACVLGVTFHRPPGGAPLQVLGGTLARTGSDPSLALLVAVALLMLGLAFEAVSRGQGRVQLRPMVASGSSSWASLVVVRAAMARRSIRLPKRT